MGKVVYAYKKHAILGAATVFLILFSFFAYLFLTTHGIIAQDDHFFHLKFAYLIRTEGLSAIKDFKWIYYTDYSQGDVRYPVSLFQVFLIPFTYFNDLIVGLKVSDAFWGSFSIAMLFYVFKKSGIRYSLIWILFLVSIFAFSFRMMIGRAFVLSSVLTLLEIHLAIEKKYRNFFLVALLHVFWHQATFFMPFAVAIIVELSRYLSLYKYTVKNLFIGLAASILGMALVSGNLFYWVKTLVMTQLSATRNGLKGEGAEIYTKDIFQILQDSEIYLMIMIIGIFITAYLYIQSKKNEHGNEDPRMVYVYSSFLFLLMSLLGVMTISGRFYDYFLASIAFFVGLVVTKCIDDKLVIFKAGVERYIVAGLCLFSLLNFTSAYINFNQIISRSDYEPVADASKWVGDRSKDGDLVFLYSWNYFPISFFYNSKNFYTMGIEPKGLLDHRPDLYWKWYNMSHNGIYCEEQRDCTDVKEAYVEKYNLASTDDKTAMQKENSKKIIDMIKNDFKAKFIIVDGLGFENLKPSSELFESTFNKKSEYNGGVMYGIELK